MADARRWSVTYTKHVKQKRKVYQDGLLAHQVSRGKVILYDGGDKLLESRFVKKDDVIESGETLAFDSYLVDIGELCDCKPTSAVTCQEKDCIVTDKPHLSNNYDCKMNSISIGRKSTFGKVKRHKISLSPSENAIREFRSREMNKYVSSPSSVDMIKSSTTEWQVLYTTQVTQKAKKFHDGYLQLIVRGSLGRQVMLYDITRKILESRFLKKHEVINPGESLAFEGHLAEIGELKGDQKAVTESRPQGKDYKIGGKIDTANHQTKVPSNKKFPAGKTPDKTTPEKRTDFNNASSEVENTNLSWGTAANEPKRAVQDILSVLRKPLLMKDDTMIKRSVAVEHGPHAERCNGNTREELRENYPDHDCRIKVLKSETVEVPAAAEKCTVYENARECEARSSTFCPSSETTYGMPSILSLESIDQNKLVSTSYVGPPFPGGAVLDFENQKPTEQTASSRSNEVVESEKHPEIFSCGEIMTGTNDAARIGLSSSKFSKDHTKEMDEFPSFDLGI